MPKQVNLKPPDHPWQPVEYLPADVAAIQALSKGNATPDQQVRAIKFIVERMCGTYDLSYRATSSRDTDFAEGKRYVGLQIVKFSRLNVAALIKKMSEQPT